MILIFTQGNNPNREQKRIGEAWKNIFKQPQSSLCYM